MDVGQRDWNLTNWEKLTIPTQPPIPVQPSRAFACLKSVPLHKDTALEQLKFLRPLLECQSTLEYLTDPPQGYLSEGVDILRRLDHIAAKLRVGKRTAYGNEFEFLADLYTLTAVRPRDRHFSYSTLLLNLFSFPFSPQFLSISEDGLSPPKVYLYDARYNSLVRTVAGDASPFSLSAKPLAMNLPDKTNVKCQNGTEFEFANKAFIRGNFTNVASGADLYNQYGTGNGTAPQAPSWSTYLMDVKNYTTNFTGHPKPVNATITGNIAGFLPQSSEFSDVAVLTVNSFQGHIGFDAFTLAPDEDSFEVYNITSDFILAAKSSNRTKLVLDMQSNSGGLIASLVILYFALFPGTPLAGSSAPTTRLARQRELQIK
ncbi:hypothetical protein VTI74DRAFT_9707 [Chaetomium olivicolor]